MPETHVPYTSLGHSSQRQLLGLRAPWHPQAWSQINGQQTKGLSLSPFIHAYPGTFSARPLSNQKGQSGSTWVLLQSKPFLEVGLWFFAGPVSCVDSCGFQLPEKGPPTALVESETVFWDSVTHRPTSGLPWEPHCSKSASAEAVRLWNHSH